MFLKAFSLNAGGHIATSSYSLFLLPDSFFSCRSSFVQPREMIQANQQNGMRKLKISIHTRTFGRNTRHTAQTKKRWTDGARENVLWNPNEATCFYGGFLLSTQKKTSLMHIRSSFWFWFAGPAKKKFTMKLQLLTLKRIS